MTTVFLVISLFWLVPALCHSLDIPLQSALLIRGEPVGFTRPTGTYRHKRSETAEAECREDEYPSPLANHCCNKCQAGFRVAAHCSGDGMKTNCTPCLQDTFNKKPTGSDRCKQCAQCLITYGQVELQRCTTKNDTVCGCRTGHYKYFPSTSTSKFRCLPCKTCDNGSVLQLCTENHDTLCECNHEFYRDFVTGNCRPCNECKDCGHQCPPTSKQPKEAAGSITTVMAATPTTASSDENTSPPPIRATLKPKPSLFAVQLEELDVVPMILAAVLGAALLVVLVVIIVKKRHTLKKIIFAVKTNSPLPATDLSGSSHLDKPLIDSSKPPFKLDSLPGHTVCVVEDPVLQQENAAQNMTLPLPDITLQTQTTFLNSPEILYKVIECIPVGRWREFIRRLGVSNHVIETSEHDYKPYKEAQYAMLSHWVHNAGSSGASRDMLFRVLREMNLGGCIERIEESL